MSSDVMEHELVERARETQALSKADITKAADLLAGGGGIQLLRTSAEPDFLRLNDAHHQKLYPGKEEQAEALKRHLNFFNSEQTFGSVILSPWKSRNPRRADQRCFNHRDQNRPDGAAGRDGRLDYLGRGDAIADCHFHPLRRQRQRSADRPADPLPGDHHGDKLRTGA